MALISINPATGEEIKSYDEHSVSEINDILYKTKCAQLGMAGYEYVQKECTSKKMARQILNIYEKII